MTNVEKAPRRQIPEVINSLSVITGSSLDGYGEDCHAYGFSKKLGFTAVFDGCGTIGSAVYPRFSGQTGAYLASRIAATASVDWFRGEQEGQKDRSFSARRKRFRALLNEYFTQFDELAGEGTASPRFPCSGLLTLLDYSSQNSIGCALTWAGDCRGYLLTQKGLALLTEDDVAEEEELAVKDETALSNYFQEGGYHFNARELSADLPIVFVSATSGAYRVFDTPAELEYTLLFTLMRSKSLEQWEQSLQTVLKNAAGDDYTLVLTAAGFRDFDAMKEYFASRAELLRTGVIEPLKDPERSIEEKNEIMTAYLEEYQRYFG